MRVHSVRVENWRNIRTLHLRDLADGVTVLAGPNRLGKSSLVQAIRCCLFDVDHDSGKAQIIGAIPLGTTERPEVAVEFEFGDDLYRITKRFSKQKDGFALLEHRTAGGWKTHTQESKAASRHTRKLLGAQTSEGNWFKLLWLNQGEAALDKEALDSDLRTAVANALGGGVTSRDRAIERLLQERANQWFTATGKTKKSSKLHELSESRIPEAQSRVEKLSERRRQLDGKLRQVDGLRRRIGELEADIERTETRREELQQRQRQQAPLQQRQEALAAQLAAARQTLASLEQSSAQWKNLTEQITNAQTAVRQRDASMRECLASCDSAEEERNKQADILGQATARRQELQSRLENLAHRRKQRNARAMAARINELRIQAARLEEQISAADSGSVNLPTTAELDEATSQWHQVQADGARLDAAAVHVELEPLQAGEIDLTLDGATEQLPVDPQDAPPAFTLNERAEIRVPGWGAIRIARSMGKAEAELRERVTTSKQRLAEFAKKYGESSESPQWLALISQKVTLAQRQSQQLAAANEQRSRIAREMEELRRQQREMGLSAEDVVSPDSAADDQLEEPESDRAEIARQESESRESLQLAEAEVARLLAEKEADLQSRREHERGVEAARRALSIAETSHQHFIDSRRQLAKRLAKTLADGGAPSETSADAEEIFNRLDFRLAEVKQNVSSLEREQAQLGESGAGELKSQTATCQLELKDFRQQLQSARDQWSQLRGEVIASEGLHGQLAEAEHALKCLKQQYQKERRAADAHRYVIDLYQSCRQGELGGMLEPVSKLVARWAREIGMSELRGLPLSDDFVPERIALARGGGEHELALSQESHGAIEQIGLLSRLALGGILATREPRVMLLDDPLVHTDGPRHQRLLRILEAAAHGDQLAEPATGPLQMIVLTCHGPRYESLADGQIIDLAAAGEFFWTPELEVTATESIASSATPSSSAAETATLVAHASPPPPRRKKKSSEPAGQKGFWE